MSTKRDTAGQSYQSPGNNPAPAGSRVTINTNNGPVSGTMTGGGYVAPTTRR